MVRRRAIIVPKDRAEALRRFLLERGLLDVSLKPIKLEVEVAFPILSSDDLSVLDFGIRFSELEFEEYRRRPGTLKEALKGTIPEGLFELIPSSYDVIGDIALIKIPEQLIRWKSEIGRALLEVNPSIKAVFNEVGPVEGKFRLRRYEHIAGEERTRTVHRENGCIFHVEVDKVYFSNRLSTERMRVVNSAEEGESVVDMFAGVGPFSIELAKHKNARVHACELNEDAYSLLLTNIRINRVESRVVATLGDAREVFSGRKDVADRVIMNYPSNSLEFLDVAVDLAKEGGVVHVYGFSSNAEEWARVVGERLSTIGCVASIEVRTVREVAPRRAIYVADLRVFRKSRKG